MEKIKTLIEENKCSCSVCKIREQKYEITKILNEAEKQLQNIANSLYNEDHFMDNEF